MVLGTILGKTRQEASTAYQGVFSKDNEIDVIGTFDVPVQLTVSRLLIEERSYNSANQVLIWGHPTYSIWGTYKWGTEADAFLSWTTVSDIQMNDTLSDAGKKEITEWLIGNAAIGIKYIKFTTNTTAVYKPTELTISNDSVSITAKLTTIDLIGETITDLAFVSDTSDTVVYYTKNITSYIKDQDHEYRVTLTIDLNKQIPLTDYGANSILKFLGGTNVTTPTHMAFGNGTIDPATSDTAMENELYRGSTTNDNSYNVFAQFETVLPQNQPPSQPVDISRLGLFDASSGGNMWVSAFIPTFNKTSRASLQQTIQIRLI